MIITIRRLLLLMAPFLLLVYYFGYADLHTYNTALQYSEMQSRPVQQGIERTVAQVKRNAPIDQLELFLKHSSFISRIVNGITLQTDLMKGSIPIDDVVGEFLNFGDVKVSDMANFKGDNVSSFIGKLRSLPKDINTSAGELEKAALAWDKLRRESKNAKDAMTPPQKEDYFTALDSFKTSFDYSLLKSANKNIKSLIIFLDEIATEVGRGDASTSSDIFSKTFVALPVALKDVVNDLKKLNGLFDTIDKNKILEDSEEVFKPVQEAIRLREFRENLKVRSTPESISIMEANFRKAFELASAAASSLQQTVFLKSLTYYRVNSKGFQRKFTSGFSNGKHDIDELFTDMQSNWIETASRGNITQSMLSKSLSPLSYFKSKLTEIDKAFGSTLNKGSYDSAVEMEKIQKQLSNIKEESVYSASFIVKLEDCNSKANVDFRATESKTIIGNAKKLGDWLVRLNETITTLDHVKLKTDSETFKASIGFTDWTDFEGSATQVPQALKNLRGNDILSNFKAMIDGIKTGIMIDVTTLQKDIDAIMNGKDKIDSFVGLEKELKVYDCFHALETESELLAHAIETTRTLKALGTSKADKVNNFESIINIVVDVSEKVKGVASIPARMIKEATSMTNETYRLPRNISDIIGAAVTSMRGAYELKKLAIVSIPQLKQIDSTIKDKLNTITDPTKKKSIVDSWGNHDQDMATLEDATKQIDKVEVDMNLANIKYINKYGKPFFQLQKMKNVNIDTKSKIQALDVLISTSSSNVELEKSKATLSTIDSLDLQFSNHQSQFQQASMAFQNFYKFFVDITTTQQKKQAYPSSVIYVADPCAKKETDYKWIGQIFGGSTLVIAVLSIGIFLVIKYFKYRMLRKFLKKFIESQKYIMEEHAYRDYKLFRLKSEYYCNLSAPFVVNDYLPSKSHRDIKLLLNPLTALKHIYLSGYEMRIHGNEITAEDGKRFFATQLPMIRSFMKKDTREDFWHVCMHQNVKNIIAACTTKELEGSPYFPMNRDTLKYGRYEVKLLSAKTVPNTDGLMRRRILIRDTVGEFRDRVFTHYHLYDWEEGMAPKGCVNVIWVLKKIRKSKNPVVVHSNLGIGRAMSVIAVYTISEAVKKNSKTSLTDELSKLRTVRWGSICTLRQSNWIQLAVCEKLNDEYRLAMDRECATIRSRFIELASRELEEDLERKDGLERKRYGKKKNDMRMEID